MRQPTRSHASKDQDKVSAACAKHCLPDEDKTRQEFKASCDISTILQRHGVGPIPQRQMTYGAVDFDLDLHAAYMASERLRSQFANLPAHVRDAYPDMVSLMTAIARGEQVSFSPATADAGSSTPAADAAAGGSGAAPPST